MCLFVLYLLFILSKSVQWTHELLDRPVLINATGILKRVLLIISVIEKNCIILLWGKKIKNLVAQQFFLPSDKYLTQ